MTHATRYRTKRRDGRFFHRRNGVGRSGDKSTSETANASGPARAPPRRKCAAPAARWRARPRDRHGRAAAAGRTGSGCRGDHRGGELGRHGRGEARRRPIAAGAA